MTSTPPSPSRAPAGYDPGDPIEMTRTSPNGIVLRWRLTLNAILGGGPVPFLISWGATQHAATSAPHGLVLDAFEIEHADPDSLAGYVCTLLGAEVDTKPGSAVRPRRSHPWSRRNGGAAMITNRETPLRTRRCFTRSSTCRRSIESTRSSTRRPTRAGGEPATPRPDAAGPRRPVVDRRHRRPRRRSSPFEGAKDLNARPRSNSTACCSWKARRTRRDRPPQAATCAPGADDFAATGEWLGRHAGVVGRRRRPGRDRRAGRPARRTAPHHRQRLAGRRHERARRPPASPRRRHPRPRRLHPGRAASRSRRRAPSPGACTRPPNSSTTPPTSQRLGRPGPRQRAPLAVFRRRVSDIVNEPADTVAERDPHHPSRLRRQRQRVRLARGAASVADHPIATLIGSSLRRSPVI